MAEGKGSKDVFRGGDAAFKSMFENHSAVIYIVDLSDLSIIDANQAALNFYGYDRKTMLTKRIPDLNTTPEDEIRAEIQNAVKEGRSFYVYKHRIANGAIRDVEIYANPITLGDRELSFSIVHDITDRKKVENALEKTNREMDAFVHTVSHDLRTPLSSIICYADLIHELSRDRLDETMLEYLDKIVVAGEKMESLINDLLTLAGGGHLQMTDEPYGSIKIVDEVIDHLSEQLKLAGVYIKVGDLPHVQMPMTHLYQIFSNLIGNAIRYGCKPGDAIEVDGERIGEMVRFCVRDHGPGIPVKERENIFEVFFRGSTGGDQEGSGIGLATVQKIARIYKGRVWVEETPEGGSTFRVEMVDVPTVVEKS